MVRSIFGFNSLSHVKVKMANQLDYERRFPIPRIVIRAAVVFIVLCLCYLGWTVRNVINGNCRMVVFDAKSMATIRDFNHYEQTTTLILGNPDLSESERAVQLLAMVNTYRKRGFLPRDRGPSKAETQLAVRLRKEAIYEAMGEGAREFMIYMDSSYSPGTRMDKAIARMQSRGASGPATGRAEPAN